MARAALTDDEVRAFRARAVRAATKLFAAQGYEGVTMRAIAEELGTSPMAPYRYFANKAEIFALVRAAAMNELVDRYAPELHGDAAPVVRLVRVRDAYVRFALENPEQYRILFELPDGEKEYPEAVAADRRALDSILECAQLAIDNGLGYGSPLLVAHVMWALVHGLVSLHLAGKLKRGLSLQELLLRTQALGLDAQRGATKTAAPRSSKPRSKRKSARKH
jgi:AcrR family transcriptional regulator